MRLLPEIIRFQTLPTEYVPFYDSKLKMAVTGQHFELQGFPVQESSICFCGPIACVVILCLLDMTKTVI